MAEKPEIVHVGKDDNNDGATFHVKQRGQDGTGKDMIPVLPIQKNDDTLAQMLTRPEGDPAADEGFPTFSFKDLSGNYIWPVTNAQGHQIVTFEGTKTKYKNNAEITSAALDTEEALVEVTLGAAGELIEEVEIVPSSFRDHKMNLYYVDNVGVSETETLLMSLRIKGAANDQPIKISCLGLDTTGGTATQALRLKTAQQRGSLEKVSAFMCAKAE